jgi:HSP20 family molecular chaperone IbpA
MSFTRSLNRFFEDVSKGLDEVFRELDNSLNTLPSRPTVDKHTDKTVIRIPVPGAEPKDVSINLHSTKAQLEVSAATHGAALNYKFSVGPQVTAEDISATVKNGLATITIVRKDPATAATKTINIVVK